MQVQGERTNYLNNAPFGESRDETSDKIKIEDLGNPETHKRLLREYVEDDTLDPEFWTEVDRLVDETVPKLKISSDHKGNKWSIRNLNFDNTFGYGKDNMIDLHHIF